MSSPKFSAVATASSFKSRLDETYITFDPKQYNQLFDEQLQKVIAANLRPRPLPSP